MAKIEGHMRGKRYSAPKLTVYGKIGELTNSVGQNLAKDGAVGKLQKTAI